MRKLAGWSATFGPGDVEAKRERMLSQYDKPWVRPAALVGNALAAAAGGAGILGWL